MAICVRCGGKVAFLGGLITTKGRICDKCTEIEALTLKLTPVFRMGKTLAMAGVLATNAQMMELAKRLLVLNTARSPLRIALCCVELQSGVSHSEKLIRLRLEKALEREELGRKALLSETDSVVIEAALAEIFEADPAPVYVERTLDIEGGALAVRFLESRELEATDPWLELLRKLAAAGHGDRTVSIVMKSSGIKTPSLCGFIAESFSPTIAPQVAQWLEQSTFPSAQVVEDFLKVARKRDKGSYADLLAAAKRKYAGSDLMGLLTGLGEDAGDAGNP